MVTTRRSILKLFGLAGAAVALPTASPAAPVSKTSTAVVPVLQTAFKPPMFADIFMVGGKVYSVPVKPVVTETGNIELLFDVDFSGTIDRVVVWGCHGDEVCRIYGGNFDTPYLFSHSTAKITISGR